MPTKHSSYYFVLLLVQATLNNIGKKRGGGGYCESTYTDKGILKEAYALRGEKESKFLKFLRAYYVDGPKSCKKGHCMLIA